MAAPTKLTKDQERKVKRWFASGATVDEAHRRAQEQGWRVSRATIGKYKALPPPAPSEITIEERLEDLEREVGSLRARLAEPTPNLNLDQEILQTIATTRSWTKDPGLDPSVKVRAVQALVELIRLADERAKLQQEPDETGLVSI